MQWGFGCCCSPGAVYRDYVRAAIPSTNYTLFDNLMNATTLAPNDISDLDDCNVYLLACYGRPRRSGSSYAGMELTSTQLGILADWVAAGGKLIFTIEYGVLFSGTPPVATTFECDSTYLALLNTFLSDCGSSLSCSQNDVYGIVVGWSTSTLNTGYALTSGISGNVYYDNGDFGGDLTGGTTIMNPTTHMVVAFDEPAGGGLIVGFSSQNIAWGKTDEGTSGNAALLELLQRVIDW